MSEREVNRERQWDAAALRPVHYCLNVVWCGCSPAARLHPARPLLWRVSNSLWESLLLSSSVGREIPVNNKQNYKTSQPSRYSFIKYWWLAQTFEKSMCVLTCAIGIDRSQNGSNMVERKPQAVQVRELFSWPTKRSKDRNKRQMIAFIMDPKISSGFEVVMQLHRLTHNFAVLSLQVHIPHPPAFLIIPANRYHLTLFHRTGEKSKVQEQP